MNESIISPPPEPESRQKTYDLATRDADYPLWSGPPRRTILVCTHARSGSTLLGEALYFAGGLGCPLEYFHRGFRPFLAQRWQAGDIRTFLQAVYRSRTDPTGTLSVKLFWSDVEDIIEEIRPPLIGSLRDIHPDALGPETYRRIREFLTGIFPNPVFIYLRRLDVIRQAISGHIAKQTGLWRLIPGVGRQTPVGEANYDYDRILTYLANLVHSNAHWRNFLQASGVPFHELVYEDILSNYDTAIGRTLGYLGHPGPPPPVRMRRQTSNDSDRMVLRFLKDIRERVPSAARDWPSLATLP